MKALSLAEPHAIIVVGIPGAGKSHFAENFADTFRAPLVSVDRLVETLASTEFAEAIALQQIAELAKTSASIVIDGLSDTRADRTELSKLLHKHGYQPLLVWTQTDVPTAKDRLTHKQRGSIKQPLSSDEYERRLKRFTAPSSAEKPIVISGKHTYASQAKVVLKHLSAQRSERVTLQPAPPRGPDATPGRRSIVVR